MPSFLTRVASLEDCFLIAAACSAQVWSGEQQ